MALTQPLQRILEQVQLALENGNVKPDVIYLTGGSARSPLIKKALAEQLPGIPIAAAMTLAPLRQGWRAGRRWCLANGVVPGGGFALPGLQDPPTSRPGKRSATRRRRNRGATLRQFPTVFHISSIFPLC
jgi:hypothetical protein